MKMPVKTLEKKILKFLEGQERVDPTTNTQELHDHFCVGRGQKAVHSSEQLTQAISNMLDDGRLVDRHGGAWSTPRRTQTMSEEDHLYGSGAPSA